MGEVAVAVADDLPGQRQDVAGRFAHERGIFRRGPFRGIEVHLYGETSAAPLTTPGRQRFLGGCAARCGGVEGLAPLGQRDFGPFGSLFEYAARPAEVAFDVPADFFQFHRSQGGAEAIPAAGDGALARVAGAVGQFGGGRGSAHAVAFFYGRIGQRQDQFFHRRRRHGFARRMIFGQLHPQRGEELGHGFVEGGGAVVQNNVDRFGGEEEL